MLAPGKEVAASLATMAFCTVCGVKEAEERVAAGVGLNGETVTAGEVEDCQMMFAVHCIPRCCLSASNFSRWRSRAER